MVFMTALFISIFCYEVGSLIMPLKISSSRKLFCTFLLAIACFRNQILYFLDSPYIVPTDIWEKLFGVSSFSAVIELFALNYHTWYRIAFIIGGVMTSFVVIAFAVLAVKDIGFLFIALYKAVDLMWRTIRARKQGVVLPISQLPSLPWYNASIICFIIAVAIAFEGTLSAMTTPEARYYSWDIGLGTKLRIAFVADPHISRLNQQDRTTEIVAKTNAAQPDLVLLGGDFVDGPVALRAKDVAPLKDLRASLGVWGISGNHEYYSGYNDWIKELRRIGVRMLEDASANLYHYDKDTKDDLNKLIKPVQIKLLGTRDRWSTHHVSKKKHARSEYDITSNDIDNNAYNENQLIDGCEQANTSLSCIPYVLPSSELIITDTEIPPTDMIIVLEHIPALARGNIKYLRDGGIDSPILQLSGHTHGGLMPGLSCLVSMLNEGFVEGWYNLGDKAKLYVTSGASLWNGFPFRLFTTPEIAIIDII